MYYLTKHGAQYAAKWDRSLEDLLSSDDLIEAIVISSAYCPQTSAMDLERIARGGSKIGLQELCKREGYKGGGTGSTGLERLPTQEIKENLKKFLDKVNSARGRINAPTRRLGFIGAEINGKWREVEDLGAALQVFRGLTSKVCVSNV